MPRDLRQAIMLQRFIRIHKLLNNWKIYVQKWKVFGVWLKFFLHFDQKLTRLQINNTSTHKFQNKEQCLTTKLTLSFVLINEKTNSSKNVVGIFFVCKKMRQKDFMNDTNVHKFFFVFICSIQNGEDALEKCMMCVNADLIARTCKHSCMCLLRSDFFSNCLFCLFCWSCLSYREMHFIQSFHSNVGFHPTKRKLCTFFVLHLFCFVCFLFTKW